MDKPITARLKLALQEHATIKSAAELSRASKVTEATVSNWLGNKIQEDQAKGLVGIKLSRALGIRAEWLFAGDKPMRTNPAVHDLREDVARYEMTASHIRFPLLEGFAGMGRGDYMGDYPEIVDFVEVTREWASQKLRNVPHEAVRVITGRGQSMRGTYNDGDLIFLDSRIKQFDADAAYCYRWHGKVHIKRLQQIGAGLVRIISANPEWPAVEVALAELEIGGMALAAWTLKEF
jgi:phage repressor protein C with HTH and peptisase S24 domain